MEYNYGDFTNGSGAMVFTGNSGNVIGISDRTNEEWNGKSKDIIAADDEWLSGKSDNYVSGGNSGEVEFKSENYNDILKVTGVPEYYWSLSDDCGMKVRDGIEEAIYAWGCGELSDSQFKSQFQDICKNRRVYLAQCRYTTGKNEKDNKRIIEGVYEYFQKRNVKVMVSLCFQKGEEIADCYGGSNKENWVYYDADYYYQSEDLRKLLQEAATEMAEEWETDAINFEDIEKNSIYTADGKLDFNSVWNYSAYMCRGIASLDDFTILPEPGFSFFYQENKHRIVQYGTLETQAGICMVKYGRGTWKLDVPFNNSCCLGELADFFNTGALFEQKGVVSHKGLLDFLSHFEIFTYFYGRNRLLAIT